MATPTGRLTLTAGTSHPTADVAAATVVHFVGGGEISVFDGSTFNDLTIPDSASFALDANTAHPGYHAAYSGFDLFAIDDGAGGVDFGTGPAWLNPTNRGTGAGTTEIELFGGFYVNKHPLNIRTGTALGDVQTIPARQATMIGGFMPAANGSACDTERNRLLFNVYNQAPRMLLVSMVGTPGYSHAGGYRAVANNAANRVAMFLGLAGVFVKAEASNFAVCTTPGSSPAISIGLDAYTFVAVGATIDVEHLFVTGQSTFNGHAEYAGYPGLGFHFLVQIEGTENGVPADFSPYRCRYAIMGSYLG